MSQKFKRPTHSMLLIARQSRATANFHAEASYTLGKAQETDIKEPGRMSGTVHAQLQGHQRRQAISSKGLRVFVGCLGGGAVRGANHRAGLAIHKVGTFQFCRPPGGTARPSPLLRHVTIDPTPPSATIMRGRCRHVLTTRAWFIEVARQGQGRYKSRIQRAKTVRRSDPRKRKRCFCSHSTR